MGASVPSTDSLSWSCERPDAAADSIGKDMSGKSINLNDESAIITHKLAEQLEIHKGDYIKVRLSGDNNWIKIKVSNITQNLTPQGILSRRKRIGNDGSDRAEKGIHTFGKADRLSEMRTDRHG